MTAPQIALAVFVLLVTPGPTNTLLALAGAERGWAGAVRLIPAELAGYLAVVVPLAVAGGAALDRLPEARTAVTLVAAGWVLWLALALWRLPPPGRAAAAGVTARRVAVTTLLNPKALVFGLVLLPGATAAELSRNLLIFAGQVVVVAAGWAGLGALSRRGHAGGTAGLPVLWRRGAAAWLALLSAFLAVRVALS